MQGEEEEENKYNVTRNKITNEHGRKYEFKTKRRKNQKDKSKYRTPHSAHHLFFYEVEALHAALQRS